MRKRRSVALSLLIVQLVLFTLLTTVASASDLPTPGANPNPGKGPSITTPKRLPATASKAPISASAYPHADNEVDIKRGSETVKYRPLKTTKLKSGQEAVADRLILGLKEGLSESDKQDIHSKVGGRLSVATKSVGEYGVSNMLVDVSGATSLEDAIKAYQADPRVRYAEPDLIMKADFNPNDPSFTNNTQWGPQKIEAPAAWSTTTGSSARVVAVLDCGVYDSTSSSYGPGHPDINGKIVARYNFTDATTGADDYCDHGTHVSGIAAANTNNGIGIAGVGFNSNIMNLKVLGDTGSGAYSWIQQGIYYAANSYVSVINMSLGGTGACLSSTQDAVNYAWARNVVIVAAAGNDGLNTVSQPANCNNVLSVAATDINDSKASFSNYGTAVDVAAPGVSIYSTNYVGSYEYFNGTSQATPHVAGLAALLSGSGYINNWEIVDRIKSTADRIPGTGTYWEAGRVNAKVAVGSGSPSTVAVTEPSWLGYFDRSPNLDIWQITQQSPTIGWSFGGYLTSGPAIAYYGGNKVEVCARGSDRAMWCRNYNGSAWGGWYSLGGELYDSPSLAARPDGVLEMFARGANGQIYSNYKLGNTWSGWYLIGGPMITGNPSATFINTNFLVITARGEDGAIWTNNRINYSWSGWYSLGSPLVSSPSVIYDKFGYGGLDVCARAYDNAIWCRTYTSAWSNWYTLGGILSSAPSLGTSSSTAGTVLYVRAVDNSIWANKKSYGYWQGWYKVP